MTEDILSQILVSVSDSNYGTSIIIFNILLSLALSLLVGWIYKKTHKGSSYSSTFLHTLVLVSIITAVAMMVIGNNVTRAFALLGTFSIIRFRTAVKDTKDTAYVFFTLVIGIAVGTNNYEIAIIATVLILTVIYLMYLSNYGSIRKYDYLLSFILDTRVAANDVFKAIFDRFLKNKSLLNVASMDDGKKLEFSFNVHLKNHDMAGSFTDELGKIEGISDASLLASKNDVEY